ncbi:MAG: mechanosensitive ion channel family protein [Candidatus Nanoarchaeia archaeon]
MIDYVTQLLSYTIYGNTTLQILIALSLFLLYPIFKKIIYYIIDNYARKLTSKSKSNLDDIIISSLLPPLNMFIIAGLFYIGVLQLNLGSFDEFAHQVFNFLLIVPFVYFMIKFSTQSIKYYLRGNSNKTKLNEAAIDIIMQLVQIVLFLIGILLILANMGYDVSALIAGLGVGGLAFALAAQDLLKNLFAGISLIFDKTFNKGERVQFQGNSGIIEELKLRSTKLRTYDGTLLTIPNSQLADNIVENVTQVPRVKVVMTIGLVYSTTAKQMKQAKKIIQDAIDNQKNADGESTTIYFDNFGAYSLNIMVYYYAKELTMDDWTKRTQMKEDVNMYILEEFEKAGLSMAFPTQTLEIKSDDAQKKTKKSKT